MSNSSIWPIDKTVSGTTTYDLKRWQSSSITGAWPSGCLFLLPGLSLGESYPSEEMQSVYSTGSADWTQFYLKKHDWLDIHIKTTSKYHLAMCVRFSWCSVFVSCLWLQFERAGITPTVSLSNPPSFLKYSMTGRFSRGYWRWMSGHDRADSDLIV